VVGPIAAEVSRIFGCRQNRLWAGFGAVSLPAPDRGVLRASVHSPRIAVPPIGEWLCLSASLT
jgi:hypothetical protein